MEMRREDLIQLAQMATNQENLLKGQADIIAKLDKMEERLRPMEGKMYTVNGITSAIVAAGMSLLIDRWRMGA